MSEMVLLVIAERKNFTITHTEIINYPYVKKWNWNPTPQLNKDLINYKFEYERQNYKTCRTCMKLFYNTKNFSSSKAKT